jgi:RimJ/RimL family protein N-acetyltransferase
MQCSLLIGFCGEVYYSVDPVHRRAALDVKFMPEAQGKGLATDALGTLIDHIFTNELEVDAVWTEPMERNIRAQRLYARCGLKRAPRPADLLTGDSYWELQRGDWEERTTNSRPSGGIA